MNNVSIYTILEWLYYIPLIFSAMIGVFYCVVIGDRILKQHGLMFIAFIVVLPFIPIVNIIWLKSLIFNER